MPLPICDLSESHALISILCSMAMSHRADSIFWIWGSLAPEVKNQHMGESQCQGAHYWALSSASEAACDSVVSIFWLCRSKHDRFHGAIKFLHGLLCSCLWPKYLDIE